jgi:hypothetical protein
VTCLLSFTRCLAYFGGPVKDGTRSDKTVGAPVQAASCTWNVRSGVRARLRAGAGK